MCSSSTETAVNMEMFKFVHMHNQSGSINVSDHFILYSNLSSGFLHIPCGLKSQRLTFDYKAPHELPPPNLLLTPEPKDC